MRSPEMDAPKKAMVRRPPMRKQTRMAIIERPAWRSCWPRRAVASPSVMARSVGAAASGLTSGRRGITEPSMSAQK